MGRYIEWDDAIDRYPELNTLGGSDELSPAFIDFAESYVDALLSNYYTTPFSNNNMTVRDLSIDNVYYRAGRFKFADAAAVNSAFMDSIKMIIDGSVGMITTSGEVIAARTQGGIVSTTQSYHGAFGVRDPIDWHIDNNQIEDEHDRTRDS